MTLSSIHEELINICSQLQVQNETSYSFRDEINQVALAQPNDAQKQKRKSEHQHAPLANSMCDKLYTQCYVREYSLDVDEANQEAKATTSSQTDFVQSLVRSNDTQDRWDEGWKIYQVNSDGRVSVQKGDRSRAASPGEFTKHTYTGSSPKIGDVISLRVYPGTNELQSGFFFAFGSTMTDQFDEFTLIRFYFNVKVEKAPALLSTLSKHLNHYAIPYRFKTLSETHAYRRADAAVLYIAKRYYPLVASILADLRSVLSEQLRSETPMFCKTLMDGLGVAENPTTGESFGMHRCRLVAEGIIDAWVAGSQTVDARLAAISQRFLKDGFNLEKTYLNPRSRDIYTASIFNGDSL